MTEQEFLALWKEDPRKADALVAEKVMGLVPCGRWELLHSGGLLGPQYGLTKPCPEHGEDGCVAFHLFPPHFTEKIAITWQVVEKMREEEFVFMLNMGSVVFARFFRITPDGLVNKDEDYWGENEDEKLAITIAALRARGEIE